MIIYILIFILLLFTSIYPNKKNESLWWIVCVFLLFVGACRSISVGTDTGAWYYSNWVVTTFDPKTWNRFTPFEPGYNLFIAFVKYFISSEYIAVYGLTFIIALSSILYVIKKYSVSPWLSLFIFYSFYFYFSYMNLMRQTLCMSIGLIGVMLYLHRRFKLIHYLAFIFILSFSIHGSLVYYLTIPFFRFLSTKKVKKYYLYAVLIISFLFFLNSDYLRQYIAYSQLVLSARYATYVDWGLQLDSNYSILENLMYSVLAASLVYINKDDKFPPLFYLLFFGVVLRSLFINIIPIISRIVDLSLIALIIIVPFYYFSIEKKREKILFMSFILVTASVIFFNSLEHNYGGVVPYKNVFF